MNVRSDTETQGSNGQLQQYANTAIDEMESTERGTKLTQVKVKFELMDANIIKNEESPMISTPVVEKSSPCKILYPVLKIDGKYHYRCCVCPKVFHQLSNLKAHWRTHSGERPFKCQKCQKPFVQRAHLLKHLPTHSGKSFACSMCGKKFAKSTALASHRRLHSEENNHACVVCGASFLELSHLINHERRMHKNLLGTKLGFDCKHCKKVYASRNSLAAHCRRSVKCHLRWKKELKQGSLQVVEERSEEVEEQKDKSEAVVVAGTSSQREMIHQIHQAEYKHDHNHEQVEVGSCDNGHQHNDHSCSTHNQEQQEPIAGPSSYDQNAYIPYEYHFEQNHHQHHNVGQQQPQSSYHGHGGQYQQPTQYLKQSLLGATPSQDYYYYNWKYTPNTFATTTNTVSYHQQYQQQAFYDNGHYQDVWFNHHGENVNQRPQ